jgi:hypothetical protein
MEGLIWEILYPDFGDAGRSVNRKLYVPVVAQRRIRDLEYEKHVIRSRMVGV